MSRPKMFVPSNFTVEGKASVTINNSEIIKRTPWNMDSVNVYKSKFTGEEVFDGWDIYTEDEPVVFIDKLESYFTQEERLV